MCFAYKPYNKACLGCAESRSSSELQRRAKVVVSKIAHRMFEVESCIRGFQVYGAVWKPRIGEILSFSRERGNREDPFAVPVQISSATVGHVPRRISCVCS